MKLADRLVVLQPKAMERVPLRFRDKTLVIIQGAAAMVGPLLDKSIKPFQVCVVGHLRSVKDPMRAARATRLLPANSSIVVKHAGAVLEPEFRERAERESAGNARYEWLGELDRRRVRQLMAECQAMVISSHHEGGARVVGESIVEGTPVIAARSEGVEGLLGADYSGYFEPGDTDALAELLQRIEFEEGFLVELKAQCEQLAPQWDPGREQTAWENLLREFEDA